MSVATTADSAVASGPAMEERGWLSKAWGGVKSFGSGLAAAGQVIVTDPLHAGAVFVDGFEKGVADVGGLIIGGIPDLVDFGSEKLFGVNLYDGSASAAVSNGLKWGIDGIEGLVGIEQPEIRGEGDQFLFGAGRLTGQVTAGSLAIVHAGAIVGAAKATASGAWAVTSGTAKTAMFVGGVANTAVIGGGAAIGADVAFNDARISGGLLSGAFNWGVEKVTGHAGVGAAWEAMAPEGAKQALSGFMVFMGEHPELAKWASFGLALLLGNGLIGGLVGDNPIMGLAGLAIAGMIAWGLSEKFKGAALDAYNESLENAPADEAAQDIAVEGADAATTTAAMEEEIEVPAAAHLPAAARETAPAPAM